VAIPFFQRKISNVLKNVQQLLWFSGA